MSHEEVRFIKQGASAPKTLALFFLRNAAEELVELLGIASTYLVGMNKSGNQKGNLSYLAGTKKRSDSLIELRRGSASGRMTMTLLKERGWSDDNDARAFLLSKSIDRGVEESKSLSGFPLRLSIFSRFLL